MKALHAEAEGRLPLVQTGGNAGLRQRKMVKALKRHTTPVTVAASGDSLSLLLSVMRSRVQKEVLLHSFKANLKNVSELVGSTRSFSALESRNRYGSSGPP